MIGAYFVTKARTDDTLLYVFAKPAQVATILQTVALLTTILLLDETIAAKKVYKYFSSPLIPYTVCHIKRESLWTDYDVTPSL